MRTPIATLAIASPSEVLRAGLQQLASGMPELALVGVAESAQSAHGLLLTVRPSILVLDVALVDELQLRIAGDRPACRVLLFSSQRHVGTRLACAEGCACAHVRVQDSFQHLRVMLQTLALCPNARIGKIACANCPAKATTRLPQLPLTQRERQVFERIGLGRGNTEIALELGLSVKTVETYRENIKRKLAIEGSTQLLLRAMQWHLGDYEPGEGPALPATRDAADTA
jgi:two-component system, NarL family, nitrate/nitrite response regulator NarL